MKEYLKKLYAVFLVVFILTGTLTVLLRQAIAPHKKDISCSLNGLIFTEKGFEKSVLVEFDGVILDYKFANGYDQFSTAADGGIWIDGKKLTVEEILFVDEDFPEWANLATINCKLILKKDFSIFIALMDTQYILPNLPIQKCLVIAPAESQSEVDVLLDSLINEKLPNSYYDIYSWFLEQA